MFDALNLFINACSPENCPGSVFNSIAAAFATQGYYKQADLLYYLTNTGLGKLAGLLYAMAAFGGIIAMVLGAPPRNYMWFFIGPAVYHWLVATPIPSYGVRWIDAGGANVAHQNEVWRIAEPGLRNNGYVMRQGITVSSANQPSGPAQVSLFFWYVDRFFSDLIEQFIPLTGIYNQAEGQGGETVLDGAPAAPTQRNWSILTDLKWEKLENMTGAQLRNGDVRDAFITFLASECGDKFAQKINDVNWIAASTGRGDKIPITVFQDDGIANGQGGAYHLNENLKSETIPMPPALTRMLSAGIHDHHQASFFHSAPGWNVKWSRGVQGAQYGFGNSIRCNEYLRILVHAFKYEAIQIYSQVLDDAPGEFSEDPEAVLYSLFYGWGLDNLASGVGDSAQKRRDYMVNLILVYLIRNEFAIAPKPVDVRYQSSDETKDYVDSQIRTIGSKTKFAEVYTWAKMVPYFQGVMLYLLAMAYPFVALMVVIPGYHKIIFTWMTFWVWTKSWDLGFAVVKVLERSIWGMIGNDPSTQAVNDKIIGMQKWMPFQGTCADKGSILGDCLIPKVQFTGTDQGIDTMENTFKALGRALSLAGNLDLDLTNSYYVYIMAALYFAVPGVTGQLILGAKSGAANLVGGMIQGLGDKASGAAASGYQGQKAGHLNANAASVAQAAYGKEMRNSGLMGDVLSQQNMAQDAGLASQALQTTSGNMSNRAQARDKGASMYSAHTAPFNYGLGPGAMAEVAGQMVGESAVKDGGSIFGSASKFGGGKGGGSSPGQPSASPGKPSGSPGGPAGRSGGSAGGAPGGSGPPRTFKDPITGLFGAAGANMNASALVAKGNALVQGDATDFGVGVLAGNTDRSIEGFGKSGEQTRATNHGQRLGQLANFQGESAAARASVSYANQIGGTASVIAGAPPGSLVKPKPMAIDPMTGGLGSGTKAVANHFAENGTFASDVAGQALLMPTGKDVNADYANVSSSLSAAYNFAKGTGQDGNESK